MKIKAVSGIMLTLLLVSMLTLAFNIQPVKAEGTIYIRSDGTVDPPTAPIQRDGDMYTFTGNIYDSIVVERDNVVVDGAGYTVQGIGSGTGINLTGRSNVTIKNLEVKAFYYGIWLFRSSSNSISGNNITNNHNGISFGWGNSNNRVSGNNITANNEHGIMLSGSSNINISENNIANNRYGIKVWSSKNSISGNNIINNYDGIMLYYSSNNTVSGNMMNGNKYNFGVEGDKPSHYMHAVDVSNLVDGKPVYYLINKMDLLINPATYPQVGYLALVNCANVTIEGLTLTNNRQGLLLAYTNNSKITDNTITNNYCGIHLDHSSNNTVSGNNITNNFNGIWLLSSSNNGISGNDITLNYYEGIRLVYSSKNVLSDNVMAGNRYNFGIEGSELSHFMNDVDASNTVDGRPIFYLVNRQNLIVEPQTYPNAGYFAVINSTNITVRHLNMENNGQGILLAYTKNSLIQNVTAINNEYGILLVKSSSNSISGSNITNNHIGVSFEGSSNNSIFRNSMANNYVGVSLEDSSDNSIFGNNITNNKCGIWPYVSSNNKIYHNNFIDNGHQTLITEAPINVWDDGYPSGGNYWSDCTDVDLFSGPYQNETGSDGIWDHSYTIDANNKDRYPLVELWTPIKATADIHPNALNLRSKSKWITARIELPEVYNVGDIDVSTILLNYEVTAESSKASGKKLIVRFDRSKVIALLPQAGEAELTITGILYDGTPFEGSDTIKVKDKRWQEISGVMGIEVDYCSYRTVQSEAGVEAVFNEYIRYCQENHIEVFGGYGNNWRFESASPHGIYEEVKYWKVNASWFDVDAGVWRLKTVFYVSQNGEVVRLLAPI